MASRKIHVRAYCRSGGRKQNRGSSGSPRRPGVWQADRAAVAASQWSLRSRMIVLAWSLFVLVSLLVATNQAFLATPVSGIDEWLNSSFSFHVKVTVTMCLSLWNLNKSKVPFDNPTLISFSFFFDFYFNIRGHEQRQTNLHTYTRRFILNQKWNRCVWKKHTDNLWVNINRSPATTRFEVDYRGNFERSSRFFDESQTSFASSNESRGRFHVAPPRLNSPRRNWRTRVCLTLVSERHGNSWVPDQSFWWTWLSRVFW